MITLVSSFENAINWIIDVIQTLSTLWSTLSEPIFTLGSLEVSYIELFSFSAIGVVLVAKLVDTFNPIG